MTTAEKEYYSLQNILSRGAIMNLVIGERSAGKTYAFKEWAYNSWLEARARGEKSLWVYARRGADEIGIAKNTLWDDFFPAENRQWEVKTKGIKCLIRPLFIEEEYEDEKGKLRKTQPEPWEEFGYFLSITEGQLYKGAAFPDVTKLCLDEFIIENKRRQYIPGEVDQFLGMIDSVFRRRDKMKVVCLSNAGAIANPYFDYYDVVSDDFKNTAWVRRNNGNVIFERYDAKQTEEQLNKHNITKISGSTYVRYALKNIFKDSSDEMVIPKPPGASPFVKVTADGEKWFTIYRSSRANGALYWIKQTNSRAKAFSMNQSLVISEAVYDRGIVTRLKTLVDNRDLYFSSPDARALFLEVIDRN